MNVASFDREPAVEIVADGVYTDFDFHGLMTIRLVDAWPDDIATVRRQLGVKPSVPTAPVTLTIRFVEHLSTAGTLKLLDLNDAAYTDDAFVIMSGKGRSSRRARIPMNRIGPGCEIECEHGISSVPLLTSIVNLIVLSTGAVALHASAVIYQGCGVLATGWAKGGKTESLLGFMSQGATFIGDEWIYLDPERDWAFGADRPFGVWKWCLDQLPEYSARLGGRDRFQLRTLAGVSKTLHGAVDGEAARGFATRGARKLLTEVDRHMRANLSPKEVFGADACKFDGRIDKVFLVGSHDSPEITVRPVEPREVIRRMIFSLQYERSELMAYYHKFRFAFPSHRNPLIDRCVELETEGLKKALSGRDCYSVDHPYPVSIAALFDAISGYCR